MGDWVEVCECPTCGTQIAIGERGGIEARMTCPPTCSAAHGPNEMEQKLTAAFPVGPVEPLT